MKINLTKVLCGVYAVLILVGTGFALASAPKVSTAEPRLKPRTAEFRETDSNTGKPELVADNADKKDVEITKLSEQVYRVDVKMTAEGLKEYENALVKFCKEHADSSVCQSPAPIDSKGNTSWKVWYWTVSTK